MAKQNSFIINIYMLKELLKRTFQTLILLILFLIIVRLGEYFLSPRGSLVYFNGEKYLLSVLTSFYLVIGKYLSWKTVREKVISLIYIVVVYWTLKIGMPVFKFTVSKEVFFIASTFSVILFIALIYKSRKL